MGLLVRPRGRDRQRGAPAPAGRQDLIDEAERDGRAGCAVLLTAIAAVGPREVAGAADAAASRVTGRASRRRGATAEAEVPLPSWTGLLGRATVGECLLWTDEFGEYCHVFCESAHADGDRRHGLDVTIDLAFHGVVSAIAMVSEPASVDRTVADLRRGKPGRRRVESIGSGLAAWCWRRSRRRGTGNARRCAAGRSRTSCATRTCRC